MRTPTYKKGLKAVLALIFCAVPVSCVTINIYFPAEEVQRTAEQIVDDIRQNPPQSKIHSHRFALLPRLLQRVEISLGPAVAHAQSETTVSNAAIRSLKDRMRSRNSQLVPYFSAGAIGENNRGFLEIRDTASLDLKSRAELSRLVDAENNDRRQLYNEVARALNIDPGQIGRVQSIFAEEWQRSAGSGWPIQRADGAWVKK